jgi:hypothetical protein
MLAPTLKARWTNLRIRFQTVVEFKKPIYHFSITGPLCS